MAKRMPPAGMDCSASADQMVKLVLRAQLKAMCKLRNQALDWKDPEGVHDMRVRSRRLRSALSDFKPFLKRIPPTSTLRTIADALGAVRDEDVAILAVEDLSANAQGEAAEGIAIIAADHRRRLERAQAKLMNVIRRKTVTDFKAEFESGLKTLTLRRVKRQGDKNIDPVMSFRALGRRVVLARIRELRRSIHHLYFPFHNTELHELRILAKQLRYAVELFADCWEPALRDCGKEIALLQTALGELHDCDLWMDSLGRLLKQTARKHAGDEAILKLRAGAGWLVKHFAKERTEHYREALSRWQEWEAKDFLGQLESSISSRLVAIELEGKPEAKNQSLGSTS